MQSLKAAFSYSDRNWQCLFSIGRSDEQFFLRLLIVESALELVNCQIVMTALLILLTRKVYVTLSVYFTK